VLHSARCKCRTQKSRQKSPSGHHPTICPFPLLWLLAFTTACTWFMLRWHDEKLSNFGYNLHKQSYVVCYLIKSIKCCFHFHSCVERNLWTGVFFCPVGCKALTQSVNTFIVCIFSVMTHMTVCGPSWLLGLTCESISLWSPHVTGQTLYIFILSFVLSSFFRHLISAIETCCTRLAGNAGCKKSPSAHHCTTLSGYIFATKARIDNWKKTC